MKEADVLLIPSFSEAAPMVIGEAACLGTPILSTRTISVNEMIVQPGYGWVCENTQEGIRESLERLLSNPEILKKCSEGMKQIVFTNADAINEFTRLSL